MPPVSFFSRLLSPVEHRALPVDPVSTPSPLLTVVTAAEVVSSQAPLVRKIKMSYGFDNRTFGNHVLPCIDGLARYLHLIPASPSAIYPGAGGAFRMALEIGLYSLHAADGRRFSQPDAGRSRDELLHRWRLASLLAGMFGELHRVLSRVEVVNPHGDCWPVGVVPLVDWLNRTSSKRYTVRFRQHPIDARPLSVHIASQVIPAEVLKYLSAGEPSVAVQLLSFLGSPAPDKNPLTDIVHRTASAVLERNMREVPEVERGAADRAGGSLLDSLRALVISPDWLPNGPASKAWYASDGFFVAWPAAAADIARCAPGLVPKGQDVVPHLLRLLQESELITSTGDKPLWRIMAPGMRLPVDAIRLASPLLALDGLTRRMTPLAQAIVLPAGSDTADVVVPAPRSVQKKQRSEVQENPTMQLFPEAGLASEAEPAQVDSAGSDAPPSLAVQYRTTINPYVRDALESIVVSVDTDNESVLAWPHEHGLFVASEAWEKAGVDSAVAVRSLFDAGMLHLNPAEPHKRVFSMPVGDHTHSGCIVRSEFLGGWREWLASRSQNETE